MAFINRITLILSVLFSFVSCSDNSMPPTFKDGNNTISGLQSKYKCEGIEFENWEDDDKTDSTLTICLINSSALPSTAVDQSYLVLKEIATQVKHAVKRPELYKSYYVIFVKKQNSFWMESRAHTMGSDFNTKDL